MGKHRRAAAQPAAAPQPALSLSEALATLSHDNLSERVAELLDAVCARGIVQQLVAQGYSEPVAQRACLEVHEKGTKSITVEAALRWLKQQDISKLDRYGADSHTALTLICV